MPDIVCVICGSEFYTKHSRQKCCSKKCSNDRENSMKVRRRAIANNRKCIVCGCLIPHGLRRKLTCSNHCKKERKSHTSKIRNSNIPQEGVSIYLKRTLGFTPPPDLVEEYTALRLLKRTLRQL